MDKDDVMKLKNDITILMSKNAAQTETIRQLKTALRAALDQLYETDDLCAHPLRLFELIEAGLFAAQAAK